MKLSHKLLTIEELSDKLGIKQSKIEELVEEKVIFAYRIGGELLRFRKEQIDAQREEIYSRCDASDYTREVPEGTSVKDEVPENKINDSQFQDGFKDKLRDFLNFYDFYMLTLLIALALLIYIFKW